jgi:hypothetical protein
MAKGTTFCNDFLGLILQGTTIANIANNASSGPLTSFYLALHTADPGAGGSQTTSEAAYTGYARIAIPRSLSGFTAPSGGVSSFVSNMDFPVSTGGPTTALTYLSIGIASSGAGKILWSGALSSSITMAVNVVPRISPATTITET